MCIRDSNCGRGLPTLRRIEGRIHDIIVTPSGGFVPGEFFPHLMKDVDGVLEFLVVQESLHKLRIDIVARRKDDVDVEYIKRNIQDYMGDVHVDINFVDEINRPPSGKRRVTISKIYRQVWK